LKAKNINLSAIQISDRDIKIGSEAMIEVGRD
jgi:hypothetical protein